MMKKFAKIGLMIVIIALAAACSNSPSIEVPSEEETETITTTKTITTQDGINFLGDVSKIYSSSTASRFVTGQIIDDYLGHKVRFEANLVEYFIIKPEILAYVEGLESNNSLMHQKYENVTYDPDKKYVEFASYTDTASGKVVCFEIRVFFGNFLETANTQLWYAKSVSFNSSFTKNLDSGADVNFGAQLENEDDENNTPSSSTTTENINNELIDLIGIPDEVYSAQNISARYCTNQIIDKDGRKARFQGNLVAYSYVNPIIAEIFDESDEFDARLNQCYSNVTYGNTKTYIEVCYWKDVDTNEIFLYELNLIDSSYFNHSYIDWYAKNLYFGEDEYEYLKENTVVLPRKSDNPVIQKIIEMIGKAAIVYTDEDTVNGYLLDNGVTAYANLVAFSSVSAKVKALFDQKTPNAWLQFDYDDIFDECPAQYTYIEIIYVYVETQKTYDIRLIDLDLIDESNNSGSPPDYYAISFEFDDLSEIQ